MSLSSTASRVSFAGNGATTAFSFPYAFHAQADLKVVLRSSAGVETTKTITTHYTISGTVTNGIYASGGTVTMVTAPASGETLIIYRDPSITQGIDLVENDSLPAETLEQGLDKGAMIAQRLKDRLDRSVRLSEGYTAAFDPTIDTTMVVADTVLAFNASANAFTAGPTVDEIENAQTYAEAASDDADAAAASAAAAASSESAASASASAAATAETNAEIAETNAETAETNAEAAEVAAEAAQAAAEAAQAAAEAAQAAAETAEANAETAETNAETAETNAETAASQAATSAANAATSESNAAASAASAATDAAATLYRWGGTAGGTADVLTLTPSPALGAYGDGVRYVFLASATNTGAVTINISGLGAKDIKQLDGTSALTAGQITNGAMVSISYDGTRFRAHEIVSIADDSITNAKAANMAQSTIKGRAAGAGTGDPTDLTAQQAKDIISTSPTVTTYTTGSGTYTVPANVKWLRVRMVGGGGGGGSSGTASWGSSGSGGNTTFGSSLLTANGGNGGGSPGGGDGGSATLSAPGIGTALIGAQGGAGGYSSGTTVAPRGAAGGGTPFGGGGGGGGVNIGGYAAKANTGGGGGGGGGGTFNAMYGGGGGGAGAFIDAIIPATLSATYAYSVGSSGAGASAGTNGYAGGNGAAGYIEITEMYV
jgi:hypothetical protein